jgi:hypothetical protein
VSIDAAKQLKVRPGDTNYPSWYTNAVAALQEQVATVAERAGCGSGGSCPSMRVGAGILDKYLADRPPVRDVA